MQQYVPGIRRFQNELFALRREQFEELAVRQSPHTLLITCSDSPIDPALFTQSSPGELFVIRNMANIIPPFGAMHGGEAASIEYAVGVLRVSNVVVCGHTHCSAIRRLLHPEPRGSLPVFEQWLSYAAPAVNRAQERLQLPQDVSVQEQLVLEEHVMLQLENLRTHPVVAAAVERGELKLHGWVYRIETGDVFSHSGTSDEFYPL